MVIDEYSLDHPENGPMSEDEYEMALEIAKLRNTILELKTQLGWTFLPKDLPRL